MKVETINKYPKIKRCKWCGKKMLEWNLKKHEEECDFNDGGKSDMNYEAIENKYL